MVYTKSLHRPRSSKMLHANKCPCGNREYKQCCEPFHQGRSIPINPEQLLRARYSAYVKLDRDFILQTWHSSTSPKDFSFPPIQWKKLIILRIKDNCIDFIARYIFNHHICELRENSEFVCEQGRWYYRGALSSQCTQTNDDLTGA